MKFFKFPTSKHKRRSWIRALNRRNWVPTANSIVCSEHFVSDWHEDDRDEVDYAPSLFVYKHTNTWTRCGWRGLTDVKLQRYDFLKEQTINYMYIDVISIVRYAILHFHDKSLLLIKQLSVHTNTYSGIRKRAPLHL